MLRTLGVAGDEFLVVLFCFSSVSTWWSEIKVVLRVVMLLVLMILVLIWILGQCQRGGVRSRWW